MTTVADKKFDRRSRRLKAGRPLYRATYSRKHGRPRNVGKVLKIKALS